jgi:hypothetical protein
MPDARLTVKLKGTPDRSASWIRILDDGRVEMELYDFSALADSMFGNDVAWMYHIDVSQKPRLRALLEQRTGRPVPDDQAMLDAFAASFSEVMQVRDWLRTEGVPFDEEFDSWA